MAHTQETKNRAAILRKKGYSINEIHKKLGIAKGTASVWLRGAEISQQGRQRLKKREEKGHEKGLHRAKVKQQKKYRKIRKEAFDSGKNQPLTKIDALCVGLYWGEGNKYNRQWGFSNSDRKTISLMISWAIRAGQPSNQFQAAVQVHPEDDISDDSIRRFWARAGIPFENIVVRRLRSKTSKKRAKGRTPYGTCQVRSIKNGARLFSFYEGQKDQLDSFK